MTDDPTPVAERPGALAWARSGAWSVLDQALFAGANFLVNILLARWLSPEAYGAFAVAFAVFLLAGTVHGGLFVEPMLVFGAGRFSDRSRSYLRVLLRAHVAFSVAAGSVLCLIGGVAWMVGEARLLMEFLAVGAASGFILALWLLRRACYTVERPDWAVGAGVVYVLVLLGGASGLVWLDALSGPATYALMAGGSAVASIILAFRLGLFHADARPDREISVRAWKAHLDYGRWSAPTGVLEWVSGATPLLVLPLFIGLEGSGTLRALYNLAMPALQVFSALSVMALPLFVRARASGQLRRTAIWIGGGVIGLGVLYGVVLLGVGTPLMDLLYRGQYQVSQGELLCLAALPVLAAMSGTLMTLLRSDERPKEVFHARSAGAVVVASVGVVLAGLLGVMGALLGELLAVATEGAVQLRSLLKPTDVQGAEDESVPLARPRESATRPAPSTPQGVGA